MTVLHRSVAHVAELGLPSCGFAIEPAVRISRALVRVVLALLAVEVCAVAVATILGTKALLRGPGLDQRSVHRKMLVRQEWFHLGVVQKLRHELLEGFPVQQAVAVLGEARRVPHRIVR